MFLKEAQAVTGGLSNPSKMPGYSYNLPAEKCIVGSRLRRHENTVCSHCYALKGRYVFPNVIKAMYRRLDSLMDPRWIECMVFEITFRYEKGHTHFRWHDSGDLQGHRHLKNIFEVCRKTPDVMHWLPTREYRFVESVVKDEDVPTNLVIRLSGHNFNEIPDTDMLVSSVHTSEEKVPGAHICQAVKTKSPCGKCRACWMHTVKHVSYGVH